jgi:hypothetical protein
MHKPWTLVNNGLFLQYWPALVNTMSRIYFLKSPFQLECANSFEPALSSVSLGLKAHTGTLGYAPSRTFFLVWKVRNPLVGPHRFLPFFTRATALVQRASNLWSPCVWWVPYPHNLSLLNPCHRYLDSLDIMYYNFQNDNFAMHAQQFFFINLHLCSQLTKPIIAKS